MQAASKTNNKKSFIHSNTIHLFWEFLRRELKNRYIGSSAGVLWVFFQPVLKLLIYSFVFSVIFRIRFTQFGNEGFLPFVAVGLWPWLAFSEALQRSVSAVQSHANLIKKIKFPHQILVFSSVSAVYLIHLSGLLLVLVILMLMGYTIHFAMLPVLLIYFLMQILISLGLGFILASFQVFLKDVSQIVTSTMMLMFYLSPVLYSVNQVPEQYRQFYLLNPMAFLIEQYRQLVMGGTWPVHQLDIIAVAASLFVFFIGYLIFGRCSRRFEEFI